MKAFHFQFDRVREWRAQQFEMEKGQLQKLFGERNRLEARRHSLDRERLEEGRRVLGAGSAVAEELVALDAYTRWVKDEARRLLEAEAATTQRIGAQQQRVAEASRRVELLDRLKQKRLSEWRFEFDREQESLAGELYLAKWRPPQAAVQPPSMDSTWPSAKPASSEQR